MIKTSHATWVALIPMLILTWYFSGMMDEYHEEKMRLQERVWQLEDDCGFVEAKKISFDVTVTTYNPTRQQCDSTPNITADGTKINPRKATQYRYVALSRDLLSRWGGPFDYGDYVIIFKSTICCKYIYSFNPFRIHSISYLIDSIPRTCSFYYNIISIIKRTSPTSK